MFTAIEFNDTTTVVTRINHRHHLEGNTFEVELYDDNGRLTLYLSDEIARKLSAAIQLVLVGYALAVPDVALGGDVTVCDWCGRPVESDGDVNEFPPGYRFAEWWRHVDNHLTSCLDKNNVLHACEVNGARRVDGVVDAYH